MSEQTPTPEANETTLTKKVMAGKFHRPEQPHKAKITRVDKLYYQAPNEEPVLFDTALSQFLESDEQPYIRKKIAETEWSFLEYGWIDPSNCSLITIDNHSGEKINLEIGIEFSSVSPVMPLCLLAPGARFTIAPCGDLPLRRLRVRALDVFPCKYTLCLFPK